MSERGLVPYSNKEEMVLAMQEMSDEMLKLGHDNVEEFLALVKQEMWDREHAMATEFNEEFKDKWAHVFELFDEGFSILSDLRDICMDHDECNDFIVEPCNTPYKRDYEAEKAWVERYEAFLARAKDMPSRGHTPNGGVYGSLVFRDDYKEKVSVDSYDATSYSSEVSRRLEPEHPRLRWDGRGNMIDPYEDQDEYEQNWSRYRYVRDTKIEAFDKVMYFLRNVMIKSESKDIRPAHNDDWKSKELKHYNLETHRLEKPHEWNVLEDRLIVDAIYGRPRKGENVYASCFSCDPHGGNELAVRTYYERGWQEMPGAPVHPTYEYFTCMRCGDERKGKEHGDFPVGGVDLIGQPLFAGMSTEEVCRQCSCYTTKQYGGSGERGSDRECWACYGEPGHY